MSALGLFRTVILFFIAAAAAGCMVIAEKALDVSALDPFFPLEDGATYTFCSSPVDGEPECLPVAISKSQRLGADWARVAPEKTDEPDSPENDMFILFFNDPSLGTLAFIRAERDDDALILSRAGTADQGVTLKVPLCGAEDGNALGAAAREAGAEVQGRGCIFPDQESLFDVATGIAPGKEFPLFDEITIRK